jgi:hypothetical protein
MTKNWREKKINKKLRKRKSTKNGGKKIGGKKARVTRRKAAPSIFMFYACSKQSKCRFRKKPFCVTDFYFDCPLKRTNDSTMPNTIHK